MKKVFWAVAAVVAVCSASGANAQKSEKGCCCEQGQKIVNECPCGQNAKLNFEKRNIHTVYVDGDINLEDVKTGLMTTGYCWRVKEKEGKKKSRSTWVTGNEVGQDVYVKLKENKKSKKVKAHVARERMFAKDINKKNGKKHVGKILEEGERYIKKGITTEDGIDIMTYEKPAKEKKEKKNKK